MQLLLDTQAFLYWVADDPLLGKKARKAIADPQNACSLSIASAWELAIKSSLGKLKLATPCHRFVAEHLAASGIRLLPLALKHLARVEVRIYHEPEGRAQYRLRPPPED